MKIKHRTLHTLEYDTEHTFPLPFDPQTDPEHVYIAANGLRAVLAFLVPDDSPLDPFDDFEEGEFFQFNRQQAHYKPRPELENFKRIVRANPGRVFPVYQYGDEYRADSTPFNSQCDGLDYADGYYIVPDDATNPARYAAGSMKTYSQWCNGNVWGVCVWTYSRKSYADPWGEPEREECWNYYGRNGYTAEELKSIFDREVTK